MNKAIPLLAIIAIAGLAALALHKGYDGVLLAGVFALIAGIGGWKAGHKKPPVKK